MPGLIIGLGGPKGAGKTTIAEALLRRHADAVRLPFAAPLKAMLAAIGVPLEALHGADKEEPLEMLCGRTARHAMQTLGTEWGRECIGPDFWGALWERQVAATRAPLVVVDDVRFPDEADRIRRLGGCVFCIQREGVANGDGHASEDWRAIAFDDFLTNHPACDVEAAADWSARFICERVRITRNERELA